MVAGHGFQIVGFVEDDGVVVGQDARARCAQGQIAEEQGVIDDQNLGILTRRRAR